MTSGDPQIDELAENYNVILGTIMMVLGSIGAILVFADRTGAGLFPMPDVWHESRDFHIVICVLLFAFAAILLKQSAPVDTTAQTRLSPFRDVRFYTRQNCSLCDKAWTVIDRFASDLGDIRVIDIDESDDLQERFNDCVPVLEINGKVRFRGGIDEALLTRLIQGARRQPATDVPQPAPGTSGSICRQSEDRDA